MSILAADREVTEHAQRLLQALLRIDTTNPPGRERPAAELVAGELADAGLEPALLEGAPGRTNVVARLAGTGELPPLLLTAHLDVVPADPSAWRHPPFAGEIADGCLWGRGAIDMKNMAAMSVAILARLARERARPRRDLIFAAVADEETGCDHGSRWLCDHHPDRVRAEHAIGEGGGFNVHLGRTSVVTVQVAEKGMCWIRARVRGEPGHGSMPRADSAVVRLAAAIARLGATRLPVHPTRPVAAFLQALVAGRPAPVRAALRPLLAPAVVSRLVGLLPDPSVARGIAAMLSNTASPTVLRAGGATNVIPGVAEAEIDGRLLPGQTTEDLLREVGRVLGPDVELEVLRSAPALENDPMRDGLYATIERVVEEHDPGTPVVPYLVPGFTDAKGFTRLGIRWTGFAPVKFPRGVRFADLYHGHDERIPLEGLAWGTRVLFDVVARFTGASGSPATTPATAQGSG